MVDIETIARVGTGMVLIWAAAAKGSAWGPERLEPYGIPRSLRTPSYIGLALAEGLVGVALLVGLPKAPLAAVALGVVFVGALLRARARGVRRLDCGCFGAKERAIEMLIARAVGFTALASLSAFETPQPSRSTLVFIALAALTVAVVALGALVFALYRQVGILSLRLGPGVALELAEEGPAIAAPAPDLDGLRGTGHELVTFFSQGCRLCRQLSPAVRALAGEGLPVRVVYEHEEPQAFERWSVPGTPFAVHVVDGTVTAKGTANTLEQLEALIATGRARVERAAA
jgi:Thioredoxin domain/Methylamine utilisation protein MauE